MRMCHHLPWLGVHLFRETVSYTPTPLFQLCSSVATKSATASLSASVSLFIQTAQPSTVPVVSATVSEPLGSPRTSVQPELNSSKILALSLLSFSTSQDFINSFMPAITSLYNTVRPRGIDLGTHTDEKIMMDQSTELK